MTVTIYHNPRCSKSRQTLALLEERGFKPEIVEYLKTPPDAATCRQLVRQLGLPAAELLRQNEKAFAELGEEASAMTEEAVVELLAAHPELLQRPVVVVGDKARIGRPPENVLEILP